MSKVWLVLLLLAAVAHSYPTDTGVSEEEILESSEEQIETSTKRTAKVSWSQVREKWAEITRHKLKNFLKNLHEEFCEEHPVDVEPPNRDDIPNGAAISKYRAMIEKVKGLVKDAKGKWKGNKEQLDKAQALICKILQDPLDPLQEDEEQIDDEDDEDRWNFKNPFKGENFKENMKKLKDKVKEGLVKAAKILKNLGVKINMMQCEEKTCRSCIEFNLPNFSHTYCISMRFLRTNKNTYIIFGIGKEGNPAVEQKIKLGDVPNCIGLGDFIGQVCVKCIEGRAKTSHGEGNVNFCLGVLADKFHIGAKFCATYKDKKLQVRYEPATFAGTLDEQGDIVVLGEDGEHGKSLGAEEFDKE